MNRVTAHQHVMPPSEGFLEGVSRRPRSGAGVGLEA